METSVAERLLRLARHSELLQDGFGAHAADEHLFVARRLAADELDRSSRAIQALSQQAEHCFVGGGVHGWRGDLDFQFAVGHLANFVLRGARLCFQGKAHAVRPGLEKVRGAHGGVERHEELALMR